jgi:ankyrin repeat protein
MRLYYLFFSIVLAFAFSGCVSVGELQSAAQRGDVKEVDKLVKEGNPVDNVDDLGQRPLFLAALHGHLDVVKYLLDHKANIDAYTTSKCWTPLGGSLYGKHEDIANYLIFKGASVDMVIDGCTEAMSNPYIDKAALTSMIAFLKKEEELKKQAAEQEAKNRQEKLKEQERLAQLNKLKEDVEKFESSKDYEGLKAYSDNNPNAVYYIQDEVLRLAMIGPKGLKVGDIREYLQDDKSEAILISMIKQQEVPYKKFTLHEIDVLIDMGLSEEVIVAMIDVTTNLLHDEKLKKQQEYYLEEQKKSTEAAAAVKQQPQVIYQNVQAQAPQPQKSDDTTDKVTNEVIKQGVGILLDQLFHR